MRAEQETRAGGFAARSYPVEFSPTGQITYCRSGGKPLKPTDEYIAV